MMLQIIMSQSKYSSDKLSKDVKRGMDNKAAAGYRPGFAALGYVNSKTNIRGMETISSDPMRYDLVNQLWRLMLTGNYTVPQLLKIAHEQLHLTNPATLNRPERKLQLSALYRMFTNPFYYGWYEWPKGSGNWIQGKHQPMITEAKFDKVQAILGRKGKPRPKEHKFAFTGLMRCGNCGAMVTADEKYKRQKNGNVHHYVYYYCSKSKNRGSDTKCLEKYVEIKDFNKQIDAVLQGLNISDRFHKWAVKYLHELRKDEARTQEATFETTQKQLSQITRNLDNLLLKYTDEKNINGALISDTEYHSLKTRLLKQRSELEQQLHAQGKQIEHWVELSERTFNFSRYARMWFENGDLETKRAIFACLGSDLFLKDQKVQLVLRKPFKFIFEGLSHAEEELLSLEPLQTTENIIDYRVLSQKIPIWSG